MNRLSGFCQISGQKSNAFAQVDRSHLALHSLQLPESQVISSWSPCVRMPPNQHAILLIPSTWLKTNRLLGGFLDTIVLLDSRTLSQVAAVLCFIGH